MLVTCGSGSFVFRSVDATDIWFDDEWVLPDWSIFDKCEILFSVWDWQDTDLELYEL